MVLVRTFMDAAIPIRLFLYDKWEAIFYIYIFFFLKHYFFFTVIYRYLVLLGAFSPIPATNSGCQLSVTASTR